MFSPVGDSAICLQMDKRQTFLHHVHMATILEREEMKGVTHWVRGLTSITFFYDPELIDYGSLCERIHERVKDISGKKIVVDRPTIDILVRYGNEFGPDLEEVASLQGVTENQFIAMHTSAKYMVALMGFVPGFPYLLNITDPPLPNIERLATPRKCVSAGSVALAGEYTGIYPFDISGGWRVIGNTTERLFDKNKNPPFLLKPGDLVCFVSVE